MDTANHMNCIKDHWDREEQKRIYSCPQYRKEFTPRPVLEKNIMLTGLVEHLKKTELQAASPDHCYAGPCNVYTERKLKAVKSCLVCLVSCCKNHLQPYYDVAQFKKHKLVDPSKKLQENACSCHDKVMKIFCRPDQQCICYLCLMDERKGQHFQLQHKGLRSRRSSRSSDVKQQMRSQQKIEVNRVKELQEKLEQVITALKKKDAELEQLSNTEDHNQFLHNYPSLYFEDVTAAVSELRDKLQDILRDTWTNISLTVTEVEVLLSEPEPKTRAGFLKYSREITLDQNTANRKLLLSEENRKVTLREEEEPYPNHPDRFTVSESI
ncbi:tripartite motif-containing protein 16-like [Anableps anableps]